MSGPAPWTVQARWLFPADGPPVEGGTLTVAGDRILAVDPPGRRQLDLDLGNVALLPGLVNAHTHLDLGGLRDCRPPADDFVRWLRTVVAYRRSAPPGASESAVRAGIAECLAGGTTLVGDIAAGGTSGPLLAASPLRAVVFYELIGLTRTRAAQSWREAEAWLRTQRATPTCRPGLSPHSPYTVRRALFRLAVRRAVRDGLPLAIHLAETRAELEVLATHGGPLAAFLREVGAWDEGGLAPNLDWIMRCCRPAETVLYAHGNYLGPAAGLRGSIVCCPRTHAAFGHAPHPFRELLARGVNVALGTDSLASNPDLSILDEMRFLRRCHPDLPGAVILRMGTLAGAAALGWERETGSLTPGKSADWITVPLDGADGDDPYELLFASQHAVRDVCVRGEWVKTAS
jgi:cytosine/adenosine deaminase-related metal-dependent hydrolase